METTINWLGQVEYHFANGILVTFHNKKWIAISHGGTVLLTPPFADANEAITYINNRFNLI
jgi:hypothetical protein